MSPRTVLEQRTDHAPLQALLEALELAVLGSDQKHTTGPLANPRTASAFTAASTFHPVDLGRGLWGVVRASADGTHRVLCVHNMSDAALTFAPDKYLDSPGKRAPLLFLSGAAYTDSDAEHGTPLCRVAARSFVWLGRFTDDDPIGEHAK